MSVDERITMTLRAQEHGHPPVIILDMTRASDVIRVKMGGVTPTLMARMGTGGNQVPLILYK